MTLKISDRWKLRVALCDKNLAALHLWHFPPFFSLSNSRRRHDSEEGDSHRRHKHKKSKKSKEGKESGGGEPAAEQENSEVTPTE